MPLLAPACLADVPCNFSETSFTYSCGQCPQGMHGDGVDCYDLSCDEKDALRCGYRCKLEEGSPMCTCPNNYKLDGDGRSCLGIILWFGFRHRLKQPEKVNLQQQETLNLTNLSRVPLTAVDFHMKQSFVF